MPDPRCAHFDALLPGSARLRKGSGGPGPLAPVFLGLLGSTGEAPAGFPEGCWVGCENHAGHARSSTGRRVRGCVGGCSLGNRALDSSLRSRKGHGSSPRGLLGAGFWVPGRGGVLSARAGACHQPAPGLRTGARDPGAWSSVASGQAKQHVDGFRCWGRVAIWGRDRVSRTWPKKRPAPRWGPGGHWTPGPLLTLLRPGFRVWSRELETGHRRPGFES